MTLWNNWDYVSYHVEFKSDLATMIELPLGETFYEDTVQRLRDRNWPVEAPARAAPFESKHPGVTSLFGANVAADVRWRRNGRPFPGPWNKLNDDLIADQKFRAWVVQEAGERLARLSGADREEHVSWIIGITAFEGCVRTIRCCDRWLAKRAELLDEQARGRRLSHYERAMIDSWFEHLRNHLAHWPERELCAELGERKRHGRKPSAFRVVNETDAFLATESSEDDDTRTRFGLDGIADSNRRDAAEQAAQNEAKVRVGKALDCLDKRTREMFRLYYFDGLTYRQIGEQFGLSAERVGTLCQQSLRKLRQWLISRGQGKGI